LDLLIAIQERPLATLDWLAKRTKTSKPTIAKRLGVLEGTRPQVPSMLDPEKGRIFTVSPILNYHNLGFEYFAVIVETKALKETIRLEKMITNHPYIRHRSRCYGATNGLFFQFRSPIGSRDNLLTFLDTLVENGLASSYHQLASSQTPAVYSALNAEDWDTSTLTWDFKWDEWFESKSEKIPSTAPKGPSGKVLTWLTRKDVYLMNEVIKSSRRKNKEILESLRKQGVEFTPQTFSRRYATIKEECFIKYRTFIDPTIFDVYNSVIISGEATKKYLKDLSDRLESNPVPFESSMRTDGKELFWYVRLQASHLSKLISRMSSDLNNLAVYLLDSSESYRYFLEPSAYDDQKHSWIQDERYMINDVLKIRS
jgi:hypothetical protein